MSSEMLPFSRSLLTCPTAETADIADCPPDSPRNRFAPPDARVSPTGHPRCPWEAQTLAHVGHKRFADYAGFTRCSQDDSAAICQFQCASLTRVCQLGNI